MIVGATESVSRRSPAWAQVAFLGLDGAVAEQKFYLFEVATAFSAELSTGSAKIAGGLKRSIPISLAISSSGFGEFMHLRKSALSQAGSMTSWSANS